MSNGIGNWVGSMLAGVIPFEIPATVTLVVGQIASGIILCIIFQIIVAILLKLLASAVTISDENPVFHVLDGLLGVVLGAVICTLVLAVVTFILLLLEEIGWYDASVMLFKDTDLFSVFYESAKNLLSPFVTKVRAIIPF
jgi:uncharacterized protein YacL